MKTRAAVLHQIGQPLRVEELDLDGPGPDEVLVRIRAAGLCHSDLSVINGDRPFRQGEEEPAATGHFVHVFVDRGTRKPTAMPPGIRACLERLVVT